MPCLTAFVEGRGSFSELAVFQPQACFTALQVILVFTLSCRSHYIFMMGCHTNALKKQENKIHSLLAWGAVTLQKACTPTVQLCVGNWRSGAICSGHLHEVCLVAIWVNSHVDSSLFFCLSAYRLFKNSQTEFLSEKPEKSFRSQRPLTQKLN